MRLTGQHKSHHAYQQRPYMSKTSFEFLAENGMHRARPLYNSYLARSDFWLFSILNKNLCCEESEPFKGLREAVVRFLSVFQDCNMSFTLMETTMSVISCQVNKSGLFSFIEVACKECRIEGNCAGRLLSLRKVQHWMLNRVPMCLVREGLVF
jgi:hypothetical protein